MSNTEATTGAKRIGPAETAPAKPVAEADSRPGEIKPSTSPPLVIEGAAAEVRTVSPIRRMPTVRGHPVGGLHATLAGPAGPAMTRLGRYHVVGRIATGGMAEVYLAVHGELAGFRTPVVLKKVLPHLACNPEFIDMFLDEARIASLLDHPNVVRIYEVGKSESEYFLAMELVQGKPMQALLRLAQETKVAALEPRLAAFIVAQAASGLHYAHNLTDPLGNGLGLVHRDVSPHNILLSFEGSVKVIDFGVARALGRITETQTGGRKGKFGYMSPEQARGEDLDLRADIFALGVVLWEAVTGRRLFQRDNDLATMRALIYDPIPKPTSVLPVGEGIEAIIMRALTRDPAQRFQTARDLALALERFVVLAGGASATDVGSVMKSHFAQDYITWQQTIRTAINLPASDAEAPAPGHNSKSVGLLAPRGGLPKPRLMLGLGAAALATLIAVLFLAVRKPPAPPEAPASAEEAALARPSVSPPTPPLPTPPLELFPPGEERDPASVRPIQPTGARVNRRRLVAPGRARPPRSEPNTTSDRRPNPF